MLEIKLFGRLRVLLDGTPITIAGRPKVIPLLGYLLLHRRTAQPRVAVANALWADVDPVDARANLRRHLRYLRDVLPPATAPWVVAEASHVRWNPDAPFRLDIDEFERLSTIPERLSQAIALYEGDLLEDVDEEWIVFDRERLRNAYFSALEVSIGALRARRQYDRAIAEARLLLARDPFREDAVRTLIGLRDEAGDRAGAVAEYERFAEALRNELGVEPMPDTTAAYRAVRDGAAPLGTLRKQAMRDSALARTSSTGPFVGREREVASLRDRWQGVARGEGSLVFVAGEAGIGKTRLLREWIVACERGGGRIAGGIATERAAEPYEPVAAALRTLAPLSLDLDVADIWRTALAPIAPEIAGGLPPALPAGDAGRERQRLFEACAVFLEAACRQRPTCIALDDVHHAGRGAVALLEFLSRRLQRSRLLILVAYRDDELDPEHPLRALRRRLERDGIAGSLALAPLSAEAVAAMVTAAADATGETTATIYAESDGNPFFVEELIEDRRERGTSGLPPTIAAVLQRRIERIDQRVQTLAQTAAVIGRSFDVEFLAETTGWRETDVLDALETLVARRLVAVTGSFDYSFRHHLVQAAFYDALTDAQRTRLHRRVAQVMERLHANDNAVASKIAFHYERGGEREASARHYMRAAQAALAIYAGEDADGYVRRVLALTSLPEREYEALLVRETLHGLRGDRIAQTSDLARAADVAASLGDDAVCEVLRRQITLASVTSDRERERSLLDDLGARAKHSSSAQWVAAWLEGLARFERSCGQLTAAREHVAQLISLAERSGDRNAYFSARLTYADTFIYEGRFEEARRALDEARALAGEQHDEAALIRTLLSFSRAALAQQDYDLMASFAQEVCERSRALGDREGEALGLHNVANGMVYAFRIKETEETFARALAIYEALQHRLGMAGASTDFGLFRIEIGLIDQGLTLLRHGREIADDIQSSWVSCVARINEAYGLRLRGDARSSLDSAKAALALARSLGSTPMESASLGVLGVAETALGDFDAAIRHLERGVELRRSANPTPRFGDNLRGLAAAYLAAERRDDALDAAEELLRVHAAHPRLAPQPAEWLATVADVLRETGHDDRAGTVVVAAQAAFRERERRIAEPTIRRAFAALPFHREFAIATAEPRRPG
jgi:DNA-binding SARP family transcriptional activator